MSLKAHWQAGAKGPAGEGGLRVRGRAIRNLNDDPLPVAHCTPPLLKFSNRRFAGPPGLHWQHATGSASERRRDPVRHWNNLNVLQ